MSIGEEEFLRQQVVQELLEKEVIRQRKVIKQLQKELAHEKKQQEEKTSNREKRTRRVKKGRRDRAEQKVRVQYIRGTHGLLKTTKEVAQEISKLTNKEYELVGEYVNSNVPVKIRHKKCGRVFEARTNNFRRDIKRGRQCVCKEEKEEGVNFKEELRKGGLEEDDVLPDEEAKQQRIKNRLRKEVGDEYTLVSQYTRHHDNVTLRHNVCGRDIIVQMSNFLYKGYRCKDCTGTISKGEKKIKDYLDTYYKGSYIHQRREIIKGVEHFYDFLIVDEAKNKLGYIEYNGRQHYKAIDYFGGKEKLTEQQKRDKAKATYAEKKKRHFLEIPYTLKDKPRAKVIDEYMKQLGFKKKKVDYRKELEAKNFTLQQEGGDNLEIQCKGCKGKQVIKKYEVHDYLNCTYCGSRVK